LPGEVKEFLKSQEPQEKTMTIFEKALGFMPRESIDFIKADKDGDLTESDLKEIYLTLTDSEFEALPQDVQDFLISLETPEETSVENNGKQRRRIVCKRCGNEYKRGDERCGVCLAPTFWKN
jgi:hypothetical protein